MNQALVMVEISLQKLDELVDIHRLLHLSELSLQTSILWRLHKTKHPIFTALHSHESRVDSGPLIGVRLRQSVALGNDSFGFDAHLLLQHVHFLLLFIEAGHIHTLIGVLSVLLLLFGLLRVAAL